MAGLCLARGAELLRYSFPGGHPLNRRRLESFYDLYEKSIGELGCVVEVVEPVQASVDELLLFHSREYVTFVEKMSRSGRGYLDYGDTPAFEGCYEAASYVAGTTLRLVRGVLAGGCRAGFNPMGGLHHAMRDRAGGFCIFNDAGVAIEYLLRQGDSFRVAYVDIDAHHGDGVYYEFEEDPRVLYVDIHQDGRTLYPGTGHRHERGRGEAEGKKLNLPLPPGSGDEAFRNALDEGLRFLEGESFDFLILQCGADGLEGDPLTGLRYSAAAHAYAAERLRRLASEKCGGRIVALGGGGYDPGNVARAWLEVVKALCR